MCVLIYGVSIALFFCLLRFFVIISSPHHSLHVVISTFHFQFLLASQFSIVGVHHLPPVHSPSDGHQVIIRSLFLHNAKMKSSTDSLTKSVRITLGCIGKGQITWSSVQAYLLPLNTTKLLYISKWLSTNLYCYQQYSKCWFPTWHPVLVLIHTCKMALPHSLPVMSLVTDLMRSLWDGFMWWPEVTAWGQSHLYRTGGLSWAGILALLNVSAGV